MASLSKIVNDIKETVKKNLPATQAVAIIGALALGLLLLAYGLHSNPNMATNFFTKTIAQHALVAGLGTAGAVGGLAAAVLGYKCPVGKKAKPA